MDEKQAERIKRYYEIAEKISAAELTEKFEKLDLTDKVGVIIALESAYKQSIKEKLALSIQTLLKNKK